MIYALSGVHGSGKTTTLKALENVPEFKNYYFASELTRTLKSFGFSINESGEDETQLGVILLHLKFLLDAESVGNDSFTDRSLLDGYVYSLYLRDHDKLRDSTFNLIENIYRTKIYKYDKIFLFKPHSGSLENDGVRSVNPEFHDSILNLFNRVVKEMDDPYLRDRIVYVEDGSVEKRVKFIREEILWKR